MKKISLGLILVLMLVFTLSPVLAKEKENEDNDRENAREKVQEIKEKVQNFLGGKPEKVGTKSASSAASLNSKKEENKKRVRNSITARVNAYTKLASRSGQLLDKLQVRIDRAKDAGKDTTDSVNAMRDARAKLADAQSKLTSLKALVGTDLDKNGFREAQKTLQAVHKDLNIVKQDASKIIRNLKSFNSNKSSTKSAEATSSSSSAKDRD
ncbi:MAG: hypothetical protein PHQ59_03285 [Candidatus Daviesbacteria bacterium]|nr:hypothetical protein [Candidatus Daviesbacteria bacterium]